MLINSLKPTIEKWSGQKLSENAYLYGIRRYLRGASLGLHVDKLPSHILSVIFQVDQKVDQPWPLNIIDHNNQSQSIFLKPGEMLIYEGAKLPHGRQFPLHGEFYDNVFLHFYPQNHE